MVQKLVKFCLCFALVIYTMCILYVHLQHYYRHMTITYFQVLELAKFAVWLQASFMLHKSYLRILLVFVISGTNNLWRFNFRGMAADTRVQLAIVLKCFY